MTVPGFRLGWRRCRWLLDLLVWLLLLLLLMIWASRYLLAGQPVVGQIELLFGSDKNMHLLLGFFLPLCLGWLLRLYRRRPLIQGGYFLGVGCLYAVDEWFQSTLSYRSASLDDFQMSMTGWLLALAVWYALRSLAAVVNRR